MRVLAALLLATAVYAAPQPSNLRAEEVAFGRFVERFSKQYEHDAAQAQAFKNFVENFAVLESARAEQPNVEFDMHQWMDEPRETLLSNRFGVMPSVEKTVPENVELVTELDKNAKTFTPVEVKSEKNTHWHWPATHVKNQGQCGSCWAFCTVAVVETMQDLHNHHLDSLSEQELVDCEHKSHGCQGGSTISALDYVREHGLEKESAYPYKGKNENCKAHGGEARFKKTIKLKEDEHFAYDWIHAHGPTTIIIHTPESLQYYKSGVFHPPGNCDSINSFHGLAIMGAGEENGTPYWWVKNSWGDHWGESGYFKMVRGKKACELHMNFFTAEY